MSPLSLKIRCAVCKLLSVFCMKDYGRVGDSEIFLNWINSMRFDFTYQEVDLLDLTAALLGSLELN